MIAAAAEEKLSPLLYLLPCNVPLIVLKAFADRPRDWADIESVLVRRQEFLNWEYINDTLAPLVVVKEAPHILARLAAARAQSET